MSKHLTRTIGIAVVLLIGVVNIYPTIGWMLLEDDPNWVNLAPDQQEAIIEDPGRADELPAPGTRQARLLKWKQEDDARAAERPGYFSSLMHEAKRWAQFDRGKVINLGLDLQGGVHMIIGFDYKEIGDEKIKELNDAGLSDSDIEERVQKTVLEQVRRRVDQFEAKEPVIQALGPNQISIQLPGEKDVERAKKLITSTAVLTFHIVASDDETAKVVGDIVNAFPERFAQYLDLDPLRGTYIVSKDNLPRVESIVKSAEKQGLIPADKMILFSRPPKPYEKQEYHLYLLDKEPIQTGEGLTAAYAMPDPGNPPNWKISFAFDAAAGAHFGTATKENLKRVMAIVLDDVVVSAATIQSQITTHGEITGSFDGNEALDLSIALDSGSMAVQVHEEYTGIVGPSLGADAVHSGVVSAISGILLVGVFMLIYYRLAGVVAIISLALNALLVIAAMAYFDMTLTLPGIAGLILTIGMAVDANVLIYERIREELRLGHSLISSVDSGFARATVTILDANVTTLIAAAVLMEFGTGPIEGFAIALSIGVCSSVYSALILSHAMFDFLVERKSVNKLTMLSLVREDVAIPFLSARWKACYTSIALIIIGAGFFGFHLFAKGDMLGVDFTQGTNVRVEIDSDTEIAAADITRVLEEAGFKEPIVQIALGRAVSGESTPEGETRRLQGFNIRVPIAGTVAAPAGGQDTAADAGAEPATEAAAVTVDTLIHQALAKLTGGNMEAVDLVSVETVGPAVAAQLAWDASWAMLFSMIFIVLYLAFRFELKYAIGAMVALVHDVLITIGILALCGEPITMNIVAAVLTIIGYSLNDTIVVFDRIREDVALTRGQGKKFTHILNGAMNSTLSRTLLTSLTTLFVVAVLWLFGGAAIHGFALALIIGIVVGTYSSLFVASPVVFALQVMRNKHTAAVESGNAEGRYRRSKKRKQQPETAEKNLDEV